MLNNDVTYHAADFEGKAQIIAYVNEEHPDDLANFIKLGFSKIGFADDIPITVSLTELYEEGMQLQVSNNTSKEIKSGFIPFTSPIASLEDFQSQYILLVQKVAKKLGKRSIEITQQIFKVIDTYKVTPHMQRLVLTTETDLSNLPAGYAYQFNVNLASSGDKNNLRYYTLRKSWQVSSKQWCAWIDVYLHTKGQDNLSNGEKWVTGLEKDSIINTEREVPEKIEHLATGQALLIADEASLPTVARLLEQWQNPVPPIVLNITKNVEEHGYFNDVAWGSLSPETVKFLNLTKKSDQSADEEIFQALTNYLAQSSITVNKVWGALDAETTKKLRPKLYEVLDLPRDELVLKVYWR